MIRASMMLAAACVATASAALSGDQQARLSQLLADESNAELAGLLSQRNGRARRADVVYSRARKEQFSVFDLGEKVSDLQKDFANAVGSNQLADVITGSIASSIGENQVLLDLVRDQAAIKADLTEMLDESTATSAKLLADFKADMGGRVAGLVAAVDAQVAERKAIATNLDTTLAGFQKEVDAQLATLDVLDKTVKDAVDKKLVPVQGAIASLDRLKLTYLGNPKIPVFRWNWWHTHQHGSTSWFDGNNPRGYGGVHPSHWTDGNARADQMNSDIKYLRRLFIMHGTANTYGASICQETFIMHSSTTGRMCGVVFRIKNTATSPVSWRPEWMFTSWNGWGEYASVSMNGQNTFTRHCNHQWCRNTVNLNIPANSDRNRMSTIVFVSGGTGSYGVSAGNNERANILQFNDNSLTLPNGLEYADDLDTATGSWKR